MRFEIITVYYFNLKSLFKMFKTSEDKHLNTRVKLSLKKEMTASSEIFWLGGPQIIKNKDNKFQKEYEVCPKSIRLIFSRGKIC
jgi:hypothetical protein